MTTNEPATATLTCPKCAGSMRTYERNGITIDQCTECRGIFLDRVELERLLEAEDVHYGGCAAAGRPARGDRTRSRVTLIPGTSTPATGTGADGRQAWGHSGDRRRRRGGFLGDLLDFG